MKIRTFLVFSLFFLMSVFVVAQTQTRTQTAKNGGTTKEDFASIIKDYYAAWNTLDLDQPARYYAKDADLVFYDIAPLKYNGWQEYRKGVENLLKSYKSLKLVPNNDLKVGRAGKVAWTTLTFHLIGTTNDGKTSDLESRHTAIWQKLHGQWLIVHEHVSVPIGGTTASQ
jgi:Ketosteroid isomerase homolog